MPISAPQPVAATPTAKPAAPHKIEFFRSYISPRAVELVNETLAAGWVSEGPMAERFEQALAATLGVRHPVTVNSGTSALHLGLALCDVGPGDEVILPAQTFVATALAILMQGATPVFADIDPWTGNLCVDSLRARLTDRTRAIMPVHYGGYPCDLAEINQLAREHGVSVVEDAAHALGATYHGAPIGNISRFTAFSFQAIKHLTTGDGGMLSSREADDADSARRSRWFGIDRRHDKPNLLGERVYQLQQVGYKYHLNDLGAALGLGNLEGFPARLARRAAIAQRYRRELAGVPGLELLRYRDDRTHAWWVFTVRVERREAFVRHLAAHGVPASVVHMRIDHHPLFGGVRADLRGQAEFDARQIALPVHEGLSDDDVERVIAAVRRGW